MNNEHLLLLPVGSFITSSIRNLKATTNPSRELAKETIGQIKIVKKFPLDARYDIVLVIWVVEVINEDIIEIIIQVINEVITEAILEVIIEAVFLYLNTT